jgi:hypothetical protein
VDFINLNNACPKDSFPLPLIDALVDSTSGYELLSFIDVFSGYNQILMHPEDQEKTAFIIDRGLYCYKVMPFGLKNVEATYQRLVIKMFQAQIGRNMEVYVDGILVKSTESVGHAHNLHKAFETLKQYGMKLNPAKCTFRVSSSWATWPQAEESRPISRRSKPSWKCNPQDHKAAPTANWKISSPKSIHLSVH